MKEDEEAPEEILTVRELTVPHFVAQIPDDLLENLSKRDQHVLKTLSVMAQQQEWQIGAIISLNSSLRSLEKRLIRVERWKGIVMSRWGVIVAITAIGGPYALPKLIGLLSK